jgi:predicted phage-related endonuclease
MRDEGDIEAVNEDVDRFWQDYVLADQLPPTITSLPSEGKAIYELYKHADGEMEPSEAMETEELAFELEDVLKQLKELNETKTSLSNELKRLVNEHKGIITHDHVITWSRTEKRDMGIRLKRRD